MNGFQVNQVFYVFWWSQRPADVAADPVKGQGLISTELTGKLEEEDSNECNTGQHANRSMMNLFPVRYHIIIVFNIKPMMVNYCTNLLTYLGEQCYHVLTSLQAHTNTVIYNF